MKIYGTVLCYYSDCFPLFLYMKFLGFCHFTRLISEDISFVTVRIKD